VGHVNGRDPELPVRCFNSTLSSLRNFGVEVGQGSSISSTFGSRGGRRGHTCLLPSRKRRNGSMNQGFQLQDLQDALNLLAISPLERRHLPCRSGKAMFPKTPCWPQRIGLENHAMGRSSAAP